MIYLVAMTMLFNNVSEKEIDFNILNQYNVNPVFGEAVAILESGWNHDSRKATVDNNLFGFYNKRFKSKNDGIHYFGKLMNGKLYRDKSIEEIAKIYCPPTHKKWAKKVRGIMYEISRNRDKW